MARKYTKVENLAEVVFARKAAGETNRQIGESYGLTKRQIEQLVNRQLRKKRLIENGYIVRSKGRPCKNRENKEISKDNEIARLKMQVELLRNFLSEVGRK